MRFLDINDRAEAKDKEAEIRSLFFDSYGKPLDPKEWNWFYVDNPVGAPFISLCYEGDLLLGHYAVIPTLLTFRGESKVGFRSMTTMVHPNGRGRGIFTTLAQRVYSSLQAAGAFLVYGFPNANSAPGFTRNLGWKLLPSDRVYDVTGEELINNRQLQSALLRGADISWDSDSILQANWRYSMPSAKLMVYPGLVIKEYEGILNILHLSVEGLRSIDKRGVYSVLVPSDFSPCLFDGAFRFDYQFGFRFFAEVDAGVDFRRELVMSDVF